MTVFWRSDTDSFTRWHI